MIKKLGHISGYVFQEWGVTVYPPHINFALKILIMGDGPKRDIDEVFYQPMI